MKFAPLPVLAILFFPSVGALAAVPGNAMNADAIYHNYCSVCHGDHGDGRSRARGSLNPPPRDFTNAPELTRETMIAIVANGKPGTAMVGWKTQLSAGEIESVVDYVSNTFIALARDPRLQRGKAVYAQNCIACHGPNGSGTNLPVGGPVPPRDLASPQARAELTQERMVRSVTLGRPGTAMAAFGERLSATDIDAVVAYVRSALMVPENSISGTNAHAGRGKRTAGSVSAAAAQDLPNHLKGDSRRGETFYMANCATCHGGKGDGKGPRAYFINPKPRNFLDPGFRASFNRAAIFSAVSNGRTGTEMPAWKPVLSEQEIANVTEFVFQRFVAAPNTRAAKP